MSEVIDRALGVLEGRITDLPEVHRAHWVLMRHPYLTDYFQAGRQVLINELKKGPRPLPRVPYFGMTALQEQTYCEWYCSHLYEGAGAIVELGTFLGSLTKSMVNGLRANPAAGASSRKVRVFDLFYWDHVMTACVRGTAYEGFCREGEWFTEKYKDSLRAWSDHTDVSQADLSKFTYDNEPIEFLMVDVMKNDQLCANVTQQFFPALIPSKGILFHQDFLHFYESWVHVIQFLLKDYFEPLAAVDGSGAFVFKCVKAVPESACNMNFPLKDSWGDDLIEEAFDWSRGIVGEQNRSAVDAAQVMMYVHLGRPENAERTYRERAMPHADDVVVSRLTNLLKQQPESWIHSLG